MLYNGYNQTVLAAVRNKNSKGYYITGIYIEIRKYSAIEILLKY